MIHYVWAVTRECKDLTMGRTFEMVSLRLVLQQTVTALGAVGGGVYLYGPAEDGRRCLRLVEDRGTPDGLPFSGGSVGTEVESASTRAIRSQQMAWLPSAPRPSTMHTGVAAVPVCSNGDVIGVLAVLTSRPAPPTTAERALLEMAARRIGRRLEDGTESPGSGDLSAEQSVHEALETVRVGAWNWNIRTGDIDWDDHMTRVLGIPPESFDGRIETWRALVHPEDLPAVVTKAEQALSKGGEYSVRHRVLRPDGTVIWVEARGRIVTGGDGHPVRMVGRLWETTETRAAMDSVGRALQHMSDGLLAADSDGRIMYVNGRAEKLLGPLSDVCGQVLWEIAALNVARLEGQCRAAMAHQAIKELDARSPSDHRWYHLRIIPVPDGLTVYLSDVTEKREREARHAAEERAAAERTARIGGLTRALAEALTVQDVVNAVAQRVLPLFGASGLIVQAFDPQGGGAVEAVGYPTSYVNRLADKPQNNPFDHALRSGRPQFVDSPQQLAAQYPGLGAFTAEGGKRAWALLPLLVSGRLVGGCVISFDQPRRLEDAERGLLIALSGLIAQTLERARLYDAEHQRAQELQRGLLPRALPQPPAVSSAARYVPASGSMLGGDWYDVIPLAGDRVALVIGDVMGHGLPEAATMGRLRTAVQTLAGIELPPDEIFAHLNELVSDLGDDFYASCLYALYDPASAKCVVVRAGHVPPAVVAPDGTVSLLDLPANPPLGAATPPFETVELVLPSESVLVLYTDGLVESAQRDIDTGIAQLARALTSSLKAAEQSVGLASQHLPAVDHGQTGRLDDLCASLTSDLLPEDEHTADDAAVLVARVHALSTDCIATWTLSDEPVAAGQARAHIRGRLAEWHLDELSLTTELIVSELVGNVVRHAKGPLQLRLIRSRTLICEVSDQSLTTPRIRHAEDTDEGGRGLQLIAALSQRWGVRYTSNGKCIWTEQPLTDTLTTGPDTAPA
ncbi:SpoIIE family protein phosphatase [Kitasatospora aureofaciens]|uniref:SpoIIE family protein phosphatase n=1 Tax=Kitasatospora aureofaciens TaxID=1894 RepID=UPI0036F47564